VSELATYVHLGFRHIVDIEAMDHILFLVALAAIYRPRDVRQALWVITAFTIGHSVTLGLAVTGVVHFPSAVIEFLIPVTIVATGVENLIASARRRAGIQSRYRPVFAGVFGLVHGAGFANYLSAMFVTRIALPLFGFNVGIELGQIVILGAAALALALVDRTIDAVIAVSRPTNAQWPALRLRIVGVSLLVVAVASRWAVERSPW
jgi:HupE / UreJ protein